VFRRKRFESSDFSDEDATPVSHAQRNSQGNSRSWLSSKVRVTKRAAIRMGWSFNEFRPMRLQLRRAALPTVRKESYPFLMVFGVYLRKA
jgi:hypothetical protein